MVWRKCSGIKRSYLGEFAPNNQAAFTIYTKTIQSDEGKVFLSGGKTLIGKGINGPFSASSLIDKYEKNELAAKKELNGKLIRVKTVAAEIGENFAKEAYIRAEGRNQFESINMLVDGNDERILSLKKGERIDVVCASSRYIMHTPILSECKLSSDYLKETEFPENIPIESTYEPTSDFQKYLIFLYKVREKETQAACVKGEKSCMAYLKTVKFIDPDEEFTRLSAENKEKAKALFSEVSFKNR